jgi:hypothetical protein
VSSILKALKKLEKEFPQQVESVSWPQKIDTKKALSKRTKGLWMRKKLIAVFCVTVLLAAGIWLFLSEKPTLIKKYFAGDALVGQKAEEERTASMQVRKKVKKGPVPVSGAENVAKKVPRPSINKTSSLDLQRKDTSAVKNSEKHNLVKKVDQKISAHVRRTTENKLKSGSRDETVIDERAAVPKTKTSSLGLVQRETAALKEYVKPRQGKMPEDKKFASAKIMEDSKIELQAIAWSIDPKERIAVINGRVVREGASLEGFTITRIGKDEVFVVQRNELRKLVFTVK